MAGLAKSFGEEFMPSAPEGFDLDALLSPIPGDTPVGADLREDFSPQSLYFRLRDARAEARAAERAAEAAEGDDQTPPQWRTVRSLASQALLEQTKDLEIAGWYTEALVRGDGIDGFSAGARLMAGLVDAFWDEGLFPTPDEDGIATRVAPIVGLNGEEQNGTLIQPLRKLAMFRRPTGDPLYYYQYEDAVAVSGIADTARRNARLEAGSLPFNDVENWARAAGAAHFAAERDRIESGQAAWAALSDALDAKAGYDSPSTGRVRDLLAEIAAAIGRYAPGRQDDPVEEAVIETAEVGDVQPGTQVARAAAPAVTREDMLRELARIADWFRKTEPNSPLAYTLDDAVRRARLGWSDLIAEVVGDQQTLHAILTTLGIRPPVDPME